MKTLTMMLISMAPLSAQIIDTVGSTQIAATSGSAKANLYQVDDSRLLFEVEFYLQIPQGTETLTFFSHRSHSRNGNGELEWTHPVTVTGTGSPAWYSSGLIAEDLAAGNHYTIGVAYTTGLTYWFDIPGPGAPISFGNWQRGHTPSSPPPQQLQFAGNDGARYHQRITTFPVNSVVNVGTGCTTPGQGAVVPRLVAAGFFNINASQDLELVDASANSIAVIALTAGAALAAPIPVFGCDVWINPTGIATAGIITSILGYASITLPIPNVPALSGQTFSSQALVLNTQIDLSNAVEFTIQ